MNGVLQCDRPHVAERLLLQFSGHPASISAKPARPAPHGPNLVNGQQRRPVVRRHQSSAAAAGGVPVRHLHVRRPDQSGPGHHFGQRFADQIDATGRNAAPPSNGSSFSVQWIHALQEDLTLTTAAAFNTSSQSIALNAINPGNSHAYHRQCSRAVSDFPNARRNVALFLLRSDFRASAANSIYQNLLVLGVSKTF